MKHLHLLTLGLLMVLATSCGSGNEAVAYSDVNYNHFHCEALTFTGPFGNTIGSTFRCVNDEVICYVVTGGVSCLPR